MGVRWYFFQGVWARTYDIKGKRGCFSFVELYVVVCNRCRNARYFLVYSSMVYVAVGT